MYTQQFYIVANVLMVIDALILIATGYMGYSISLEATPEGLVMGWYDFLGFVLFLMFANNYFMGSTGFYSARRFSSTWSMIKALFIAVLLSFVLLSAGVVLIGIKPFSRVYLIAHFLTAMAALIVTRIIFYYFLDRRARTTFNSRQILLVGSADRVIAVAEALNKQRSWGHQVAGCLNVNGQSNPHAGNIPVLGRLEDFDTILQEHQIDEVMFALPKGSPVDLNKYMLKCKITGVAVRIIPALFDLSDSSFRVESIQGIPTLTDYAAITSASGLLYKKLLDLAAGLLGFMVFILSYPIMWLIIKLDSPGPVLFKQRRVGMHGRQFYLYKFRSMVADAESKKTDLLVEKKTAWPSYKTEHDPRITRVGRFLRKTSLDEFPQFINVLKGEMSLVGTRPPTPNEVKHYKDWQRRRISIKPGITGLWQISGRKEITDFTEVVRLDLEYIDGWRFRKDLIILWKTVWVVLARKGAR
ncbi:MAG: sugar transferase [Deltaproteobacteria bacterium]|jgi:exopolysaccharide biosynthesis polyprenyl glycosylphosphotransferase|nr:sugar transferase [Deltaproteobacteria bacterium]